MNTIDTILKLAGVKSPQELYAKYGSEEEFMKVHGGAFKKAQRGAKIAKAQMGNIIPVGTSSPSLNMANNFQISQQVPQLASQQPTQQVTQQGMDAFNSVVNKPNLASGIPILGDVVKGFQQLKDEKNKLKKAKQWSGVTDIMKDASQTTDVEANKQDNLLQRAFYNNINTGAAYYPTYGVGNEGIGGYAKNGGEIINTYAPNTLYKDLESAQNGAFMQGLTNFAGGIDKNQLNNLAVGLSGGDSGGATLGGAAGDAVSMIPGIGPIVSKFAKPVLSAVGNLLDTNPEKIKKYQKATDRNIGTMALGQGMTNVFNQHNKFMEDGGYLSNDWQPQVITQFGGHKLSDLLKRDETMNTLRTGGNLRSNMQDEGELQVGRGNTKSLSYNPFLPDGGETVEFQGPSHAEGGMPVAFGNSPVEVEGGEPAVKMQDGGNNENLVVYGNLKAPGYGGKKFKNIVKDISTKEDRLNKLVTKSTNNINDEEMITPFDKLKQDSFAANIKGANMKLKKFADEKQHLASLQDAINTTAEKYGLVADDLAKGNVKYAKNGGKLTADGGINIPGITPKYVDDVYQKLANRNEDFRISNGFPMLKGTELANRIYNDYLISKIGKGTTGNVNPQYEDILTPWVNRLNQIEQGTSEGPSSVQDYIDRTNSWEQGADPLDAQRIASSKNNIVNSKSNVVSKATEPTKSSTTDKDKGKWSDYMMEAISTLVPYLRPSDTERLDPRQILGELSAMSDKEEPVQASMYHPQLSTPYNMVLPGREDIVAQMRSAQKLAGYNPAAQAAIAAQAYSPLADINSKEFMINQEQANKTYNQNRDITNQAQLQNLQIADNQYTRQAQAKSNTKALLRNALNSISAKYLQNQAENRTLATYENLYNYRFDDRFRKQNWNQPMEWNMEGSDRSMTSNTVPEGYEYIYNKQGQPIDIRKMTKSEKSSTRESKNGGLVRAIHNL
jgi:hypothetical protein